MSSKDNTTVGYALEEYPCEYSEVWANAYRLCVYILPPIIIAGLVLNFINVVVLRRIKSSSNAFFMLQFMALSDILYLLVCLVYFTVRRLIEQLEHGDMVFKRRGWYIQTETLIVVDPLYHMLLVSRNWMVSVITVERLLNIWFPFWARTAITRLRLKVVIVGVFALGFVLHATKWATWHFVEGVNICTGEPQMIIRVTQDVYVSEYYLYITMTVIGPMVAIYICNLLLLLSLKRASVDRNKMSGDSTKEGAQQRQAVVIVIAMSMVFTVFETPACLDRILTLIGFEETPLTLAMRQFALILNITDSTVNFVAYCATSRPFRKSFREMFARGVRSRIQTISTNIVRTAE